MILLTRLSGSPFVLNSDLIERIDSTPDTVVTLVDGSKYVVSEDMRTVVGAIRRHRAEIIALSEALQIAGEAASADDQAVSDRWATLLGGQPEPGSARPALSVVHPGDPTDTRAGAKL